MSPSFPSSELPINYYREAVANQDYCVNRQTDHDINERGYDETSALNNGTKQFSAPYLPQQVCTSIEAHPSSSDELEELGDSVKKVYYRGRICLEVLVIGFPHRGESILFFLKDDDSIKYSGLVDCYQNSNINVVQHILQKNNVKSLDFICWTHTHIDHTLGLNAILENNITTTTEFLVPPYPEHYVESGTKSTNKLYRKFKRIMREIGNKGIIAKEAKNCMHVTDIVLKENEGKNKTYVMQISSFAPRDEVLFPKEVNANTPTGNDYSIALSIKLGKNSFILAGDIENKTIECAHKYGRFPAKIAYVKIPHHGSKTAEMLCDVLKSRSITPFTAVTTCFSKFDLPDVKVLIHYKDLCANVYMTSGKEDTCTNPSDYGIVKTSYTIPSSGDAEINTDTSGSACEFKTS